MEMIQDQINRDIPGIFQKYKKIAVVGASDKPHRDSYQVARVMKQAGYRIFPVNPNVSEILGVECYSTLLEIQENVELVDIFRRPEHVEPIVEQAIRIGAKAVWMQLGVANEAAAKKALDAGLEVIMNRCWKIEYYNYGPF